MAQAWCVDHFFPESGIQTASAAASLQCSASPAHTNCTFSASDRLWVPYFLILFVHSVVFFFLQTFVLMQNNPICIQDFLFPFSTDKKRGLPPIQRDPPSAAQPPGLLQAPQPRVRGSRAEGPAHSAVQPPQNPQQVSGCPAPLHPWCLPDPPWPGGCSKGGSFQHFLGYSGCVCPAWCTVYLPAALHRAGRQERRNLPWESGAAQWEGKTWLSFCVIYTRLCVCDLTGAGNNPVGLYLQCTILQEKSSCHPPMVVWPNTWSPGSEREDLILDSGSVLLLTVG